MIIQEEIEFEKSNEFNFIILDYWRVANKFESVNILNNDILFFLFERTMNDYKMEHL